MSRDQKPHLKGTLMYGNVLEHGLSRGGIDV